MSEPTEYVFLAGDAVPEWIERITVEPPEAGRAWMTFSADCEVERHANRVVVRPIFPLTKEAPDFMRVDTDRYIAGTVHINGAPTHLDGQSRYFPNPLIEWDDDDAEPWGDPLNGGMPQ